MRIGPFLDDLAAHERERAQRDPEQDERPVRAEQEVLERDLAQDLLVRDPDHHTEDDEQDREGEERFPARVRDMEPELLEDHELDDVEHGRTQVLD